MRVSEAFVLLLLLALWGSAEAKMSDTSTSSENINQRTPGISSHRTLEYSTSGPSSTMKSSGQTEKIPVLNETIKVHAGPSSTMESLGQTEKIPVLNDTIIIHGFPRISETKSITLESPAELELMCSLVISIATNMEQMETAWNSGNETIKEETIRRNETHTKWCTRNTIKVRNKDQMGNYTCVFKTKPEINATFHLQVPPVHIKSEHIVSYVGDTVILSCDVGNEETPYNPSFWIWYTNNGSEEVVINSTLMPEKYSLIQPHANTTKLKILDLSELDSNFYWCKAEFPLGESKGRVTLKVLTYLAPLKPFLIIAAEVVILVALIFINEVRSRKKEENIEVEKEFEQTETLKLEDSNGVENSTIRQRKA